MFFWRRVDLKDEKYSRAAAAAVSWDEKRGSGRQTQELKLTLTLKIKQIRVVLFV